MSVLRQFRTGYDRCPAWIPQGVILCRARDVLDYRAYSRADKGYAMGGSAFNIKSTSLRRGADAAGPAH